MIYYRIYSNKRGGTSDYFEAERRRVFEGGAYLTLGRDK